MKVVRIVLLTAVLAGAVLAQVFEEHESHSLKDWDAPKPEAVGMYGYVEACTWDGYLVHGNRLWVRDSLQNRPSEVKLCPT